SQHAGAPFNDARGGRLVPGVAVNLGPAHTERSFWRTRSLIACASRVPCGNWLLPGKLAPPSRNDAGAVGFVTGPATPAQWASCRLSTGRAAALPGALRRLPHRTPRGRRQHGRVLAVGEAEHERRGRHGEDAAGAVAVGALERELEIEGVRVGRFVVGERALVLEAPLVLPAVVGTRRDVEDLGERARNGLVERQPRAGAPGVPQELHDLERVAILADLLERHRRIAAVESRLGELGLLQHRRPLAAAVFEHGGVERRALALAAVEDPFIIHVVLAEDDDVLRHAALRVARRQQLDADRVFVRGDESFDVFGGEADVVLDRAAGHVTAERLRRGQLIVGRERRQRGLLGEGWND